MSKNTIYQQTNLEKLVVFLMSQDNLLYEEETWKEIITGKDNGQYFLSDRARVLSLYSGVYRILTPFKVGKYLAVDIHDKRVKLHQLIGEYFLEKEPGQTVVHHKDLNPYNNHKDNLIWMTDEEHRKLHAKLRAERTRSKDEEVLHTV